VVFARGYYHVLYFSFFRDRDVDLITANELCTDVFLNETSYFGTPPCMAAQLILRSVKLIRADPENYARALVHSSKRLPMKFFAFLTFPALYQIFTSAESAEAAIQFMLRLLSIGASSQLFQPLFQAFLFSTYPFTDALWCHFHRDFCARDKVDDVLIMSRLVRSIEACAALLPPTLAPLVSAFLEKDVRLCCASVIVYLQRTFTLWYDHCSEGMSFGSGQQVLEWLDAAQSDFECGNSITLVSAFIAHRSAVPIYPINAEICDVHSEAIILSRRDFRWVREAFKAVEQRLSLCREVEKDDRVPTYFPFLLDFFASRARHRDGFVFLSKPRSSSLFKDLMDRNSGAPSKLHANLVELEDFFSLSLAFKGVRNFQKSIARFRDAAFASFLRDHVHLGVGHRQIVTVAQELIGQSSERQSLVIPLLVELLNAAILPDPDTRLRQHFWSLRKDYLAQSSGEIISYPGKKWIIDLLNEFTRRPLTLKGDVFILFSHVFWVVRKISRYFKLPAREASNLVKFLSLSSDFSGLLMVFLVFDKLVFQNNFFVGLLSEKMVRDWKTFVAVMWDTIAKDTQLCADVASYASTDFESGGQQQPGRDGS
jgi:hypothetical protein